MARVRVKICGITRPDDALAAAEAGADAIGLVFAQSSPRQISLQQACRIVADLPPLVSTVALFLDPTDQDVENTIRRLRPSYLQFHGAESPDFCRSFDWPYIKALAMQGQVNFAEKAQGWDSAAALLLDGHAAGEQGGQGKCFNWDVIPPNYRQALILAGGLNPENVSEAVQRTRPWAVDVSSGVESSPGIKSTKKMRAFVENARNF
ncbi:MAG: N-(5'-phosphoribosyl)anthranilate isomerase [Lysobacteraceae bacterium]|nr:MAG: N-(5'-phosphoribosyl)anthranilate isomerase [Xanthomonadaceae bacterium]